MSKVVVLNDVEDFVAEEINCPNLKIDVLGELLCEKINKDNQCNPELNDCNDLDDTEECDKNEDLVTLYIARSTIDGLPLFVSERQTEMEEQLGLPKKSVSARLSSNSSGRNTKYVIERVFVPRNELEF